MTRNFNLGKDQSQILGPSNQDQHQFNKLGLKHENQAPFAMIPGEDGCDTIHPSNGKMSANEFPIDPNEPTYCFCKQVAFGEMIACDNDDVSIFSQCSAISNGFTLSVLI